MHKKSADFSALFLCSYGFRLFVLQIPGQIGHEEQRRDDRCHDGDPQSKVGRQDVQNGGCGLRPGHVEVIGPGDHQVHAVGNDCQNDQRPEGLEGGFYRGPHAVDEDHVEDGDIEQGVGGPELVVAEPGGAGVGQGRGGQQGEEGAAEDPEIADVKEGLSLADDHVAAEDGGPAAHTDGQILHRAGLQGGYAHQPPVVAHLRADQREGQHIADGLLVLPGAEPVGVFADQPDHGQHPEDGREMGRGEQGELLSLALAEEVDEKVFHGVSLSFFCILEPPLLYHRPEGASSFTKNIPRRGSAAGNSEERSAVSCFVLWLQYTRWPGGIL